MTPPMFWWWVSLADPRRPKGQQSIGAVIVRAADEAGAGLLARGRAQNAAHAELFIGQMPPERGDPPPAYIDRLLTREEAEALIAEWVPGGRLATQEEVRAAIMNDAAVDGQPLFDPRRSKR